MRQWRSPEERRKHAQQLAWWPPGVPCCCSQCIVAAMLFVLAPSLLVSLAGFFNKINYSHH